MRIANNTPSQSLYVEVHQLHTLDEIAAKWEKEGSGAGITHHQAAEVLVLEGVYESICRHSNIEKKHWHPPWQSTLA